MQIHAHAKLSVQERKKMWCVLVCATIKSKTITTKYRNKLFLLGLHFFVCSCAFSSNSLKDAKKKMKKGRSFHCAFFCCFVLYISIYIILSFFNFLWFYQLLSFKASHFSSFILLFPFVFTITTWLSRYSSFSIYFTQFNVCLALSSIVTILSIVFFFCSFCLFEGKKISLDRGKKHGDTSKRRTSKQ